MPVSFALTGLVLAGGGSVRMGKDKALLPFEGGPLIVSIRDAIAPFCEEVLISANDPERFRFLGCPIVPDRHPGIGPLAGLHAGLLAARNPWTFAIACDMPYFQKEVLEAEIAASRDGEADVVFLEGEGEPEPFHALYHKRLLPTIEEAIAAGELAMHSLLVRARTRTISNAQLRRLDPEGLCLRNWNSPGDTMRHRENGDTMRHRVPDFP